MKLVPTSALAAPLTAAVLFAASTSAQIDLRATGGSVPGDLDVLLSAPVAQPTSGVLFVSLGPGPVPIGLFDPVDTRSLSITLTPPQFQVDVFGILAPPVGTIALNAQVPNQANLIGASLYFQGVTFPGFPTFIDELSLPRRVQFGPAASFSDRGVAQATGRSFFPILSASDGRSLIAGGGAGTIFAQIPTPATEFYDPFTDTLTPGPTMTIPRSLHTATELLDGRWLIAGGVNGTNDPTPECEIWDPVAGTFTGTAPMSQRRGGHVAARLPDGKVLVAGGLQDTSQQGSLLDPIFSATSSVEIYDPTTGTWSNGPSLSRPRIAPVLIQRADGRILIGGGVSFFLFLPQVPNSTDLYDPSNNSMGSGPALASARSLATMTDLGNGRHLLTGGVGAITLTNLGTATAAAEVYDEATNSFTSTGALGIPRVTHQAFALDGTRVLITGGGQGSLLGITPTDTCEIWDSATGQFSSASSMAFARAGHALYETPSGALHLVGGESAGGLANTSTEFYFR